MESPFVGAAACSFWTRFGFLVWFFLCGVRLEHSSRGHFQGCQVSTQLAGGLTRLLG